MEAVLYSHDLAVRGARTVITRSVFITKHLVLLHWYHLRFRSDRNGFVCVIAAYETLTSGGIFCQEICPNGGTPFDQLGSRHWRCYHWQWTNAAWTGPYTFGFSQLQVSSEGMHPSCSGTFTAICMNSSNAGVTDVGSLTTKISLGFCW